MIMLRYGGISSAVMLKKKGPSSGSSCSCSSNSNPNPNSNSNSIYAVESAKVEVSAVNDGKGKDVGRRWYRRPAIAAAATGLVAAAMMLSTAWAIDQESTETLSNIPQTLSGECPSMEDCRKARIQRPKSRKAESCTIKCVTTCIRGGDGSPGEGPLNIRRPLVVFKQGFRSRQYCLVECSDICNLIGDGDDGP